MTSQKVLLGVDVASFVNVMRRSFDAPHVHIRELVQNALEATFQAVRLGAEPGPIRISTNIDSGTLSLSDNGIGMTRDELATSLTHVFSSGWPTQPGDTLGIGQFGFGFFSVFLVANEVVVTTRARQSPGLAHRWRLSLDDPEPIVSIDRVTGHLPDLGTTVTLRLMTAESYGTDADFISEQLIEHYLYLPFPVIIDSIPIGIPTTQGWRNRTVNAPVDPEIASWLRERWKWRSAPMDVSPARVGNGGWLAIAPKHETVPKVEIYRRGIKVAEQELIPYPLNFFMCGLIDIDNITVKPDRETLLRDAQYHSLKTSLEARVKQLLLDLARTSSFKARKIFATHRHPFVSSMLKHEDLRKGLGLLIPLPLFFSGYLGEEEDITLQECIDASESKGIYWAHERGTDDLFADRSRHLGRHPVYLDDPDLRELVETICNEHGIEFTHVASAYLAEMQSRAEARPELRDIFLSVLEPDWDVLLAEDVDARLPVKTMNLSTLPPRRSFRPKKRDAYNSHHVAIVNLRNRLIVDFNGAVVGGIADRESLQQFARIMIGMARISGDNQRRAQDFESVNREVLTLLHGLIVKQHQQPE